MPNCKCACHDEEKEITTVEKFILGGIKGFGFAFQVSIYILLYAFLMAGAFASVIILVKMYPEFASGVNAFLTFSSNAGTVAAISLACLFLFGIFHWIFYGRHQTKSTKEVK